MPVATQSTSAAFSRSSSFRECGALAILTVISLLANTAIGQCAVREGDSVWCVSSCHLGCPDDDAPDLRFRRYDGRWHSSDLSEFLADGSTDQITCIFVHAARNDVGTTYSRGLSLYHRMARRCGERLRFVMWMWPSPRSHKILRDFRVSYQLMDRHAYYLGWFLSQMPEDSRVSLIGFSMGAGVIAGGVHVAAGGPLAGRQLPGDGGPARINVVLWSAAFHNCWLTPGSHYGQAITRIGDALVLYNSLDPVLKRYRLVEPCSHVRAIGYTGIVWARGKPDDLSATLQQIDGRQWLGRHHEYDRHAASSQIMGRSLAKLLWEN